MLRQTDSQSVSLSWCQAPIVGLRPDFYYCQTVAGFLMWGALSGERTCLSCTTAAGPRQRSYSRFRVPWDSWPYFTASYSRLPFSSSPTSCRVTVEVFDLASTRDDWGTESGVSVAPVVFLKTPLHGPCRKRIFQKQLYCCVHIRCPGNLLTDPLLRNGRCLFAYLAVIAYERLYTLRD
jgi:hypothetical protein